MAELRPSGAEGMLRIAAPLWFTKPGTQSILATGSVEGSYADRLRERDFLSTTFRLQRSRGSSRPFSR